MRDHRVQAVGALSCAAAFAGAFAAGTAAGARRRRRAAGECTPPLRETISLSATAPPAPPDDGWEPGPLRSDPFWFDTPPGPPVAAPVRRRVAPEPVAVRERVVEDAMPVAPAAEPPATDGWGWTEIRAAEEEAERRRAEARRRERSRRRERPGRRRMRRSFALVFVFAAGGAGAAFAIPRKAAIIAPRAPAPALAGRPAPSVYARRTVPARYLRLYRQAGAEYGLDWTVLAAVGQVESDQGRSAEPGVASGTNAAGAAGPAQFLTATWQRFGVNADGRGTMSPYDPADAITSMAAYLKASGAPEDWTRALFTYNHSSVYVDQVLALSRRFVASS